MKSQSAHSGRVEQRKAVHLSHITGDDAGERQAFMNIGKCYGAKVMPIIISKSSWSKRSNEYKTQRHTKEQEQLFRLNMVVCLSMK